MLSKADLQHFKTKLLDKQKDLQADIARLKEDARNVGQSEVRDSIDDATAAQDSGDALEGITLESRTLEQVEDALKRIEQGTYGTCITCGRPIDPARLEAIPWTPYCLDDQAKQDQ